MGKTDFFSINKFTQHVKDICYCSGFYGINEAHAFSQPNATHHFSESQSSHILRTV